MQSSFDSRLDSVDMDSHGLIKVLKDNLRDYPQDTVLRELIQNADDAEATFFACIHIHASQSKTVSPAVGAGKLILINDGPVSDEQRAKMFRLRAGWQIGNESKIGKFGLGLKSIFHWCDFGWKMQLIQETGWQAKFVDPVGAPNLPLDRIRSRDDDASVLDQVQHLIKKHFGTVKKDLFVLVLALRDESTCSFLRGECNYQPISNIPTDFDKNIESDHLNMSRLLPCLSTLEKVVTIVGEKVIESTLVVKNQYPNCFSRLNRLDTRMPKSFKSLGFIKSVLHGTTFDVTPFALLATEVTNEHLTRIYNSDGWPTEWISDETGDHQVKEKAVQTGGIILIGNGTKRVRVLHANYLPLAEVLLDTEISVACGFDILIHGTFHIDSKRKSLLKLNLKHDQLRTDWNTALYQYVVSPLIIESIYTFLTVMIPDVLLDDEDKVWDLIRTYDEKALDYFGESGITNRFQLIRRIENNGSQRYVVDNKRRDVFTLPNIIKTNSSSFDNYQGALEQCIFTNTPDKCLLHGSINVLRNPLSLFSIRESTELSVLANVARSLTKDQYVRQDSKIDGSSIARVFHWHWQNGKVPKSDIDMDWIKPLCQMVLVRSSYFENTKYLLDVLIRSLPKNAVITSVNPKSEPEYRNDFIESAKLMRPCLAKFESFKDENKKIAGAALFFELSIELGFVDLNKVRQAWPYYDARTQYLVPLRNLQYPQLSFELVTNVSKHMRDGKCVVRSDSFNRYNLVKLLDSSTEFQIEGISTHSLEKIGFRNELNTEEFVGYITSLDRFSQNKHISSECLENLLSKYKDAKNRAQIDICALKIATWNSSSKWIAIERDLSSPLVTKLLQRLGHMYIGEAENCNFDAKSIELLESHAISFPDNECVRLLNSSNLQLAIDEATDDELSRITFVQPDAARTYLQTVARISTDTLKKLPIVVSKFGKSVIPSKAKNGVFVVGSDLRIPIISEAETDLLLKLQIDFVVPDGLLINDSDCVNDNQLFDIIVRQSFAGRVWSESQRNRLDNLYKQLASRGKIKAHLAAKSLRQHVIPNLLDGQSVYLEGDCPEPITTALMEVFHIRLLGDTTDPVINDICDIDSELSQQLIPQLSIQVIEEEIWNEDSLESWTDYWRKNSDILPTRQRMVIHKWIEANKQAAKSLEFYAPLPIYKTWCGELCSPITNNIPAAKVDFSWLRYIPKNHDFFVVPSLLNLEAYSETELFEYVTREVDNLGETIWKNITEFGSVLRSKESTSYLAKIPFIDVKGTYRTVHEVLIPSAEHKTLDENIACILGKSTEAPDFIESFPVFTATRQDVTSHLQTVCESIASDPQKYTIGNHQFTVDHIRIICESVSKPKHPTIRLLKAIVESDSLSLSDRNKLVSDVLVAAKGYRCDAAAILTFDLCHAGLEENPNIKNLIVDLITSDIGNRTIDFCVPTSDQKWSSARTTLVHNFNVPDDNVLDSEYGREIPANMGSSAISDISEYFEHDVWADFQSLKSATLAMLGLSTKSLEFAQSGLPTGENTVDLTSGFERVRLTNVAFYVRHMNKKTRMQLCNGHFADIETSPDQLKSLVDHIDITTDQTKVYLVLPTAHVDPNELRTLLLELAPSIYSELGMDAKECKGRLEKLSDDGQTTITETQQIALSRFQTTLQMIGQTRMPAELLKLAEELTDQQIRLGKSQSNILGRRQQGKSVQLDETELDLIERNIEIQATVVELLEKESTIHKQSVEAIREATTRYSYDKLSFAFELIQNADDALEQLKDLNEFTVEDAEVIVDLSTGAFILAHPGRRINYFQNKDRSKEMKKFKNDLVYMLTLNLTDKADVEVSSKDEQQYRPVTGKYGLGFKSVYHVTDDVKITSGELATEFRCGIWPKKLDSESRSTLDSWREQRNLSKSCTVIRLGGVTQVPKDFIDALVLLPLSTRNIRSIKYIDSAGKTTTFSCKSTRLTDYVNLIETTSKRTFLQVVGTDNYTWQCFELVDGLPVRVKDMSNYWVTVPTRVEHKPGFVCNAAFPLNSARTHVEHNDIMYVPFCSNFADVMAPAYRSLFRYLSNSKAKPQLGMNVLGTISANEAKLRLGIEGILTSDNRLFEFLNLEGLPVDYQELAIQSLSRYTTSNQKTQMLADVRAHTSPSDDPIGVENEQEKDKNRPTESSIPTLFKNLRSVDGAWQQEMDGILYGNQMPNDWFEFITDFQTDNDHAREVWHRLILRSTFESVGVLRNAYSCRGLLSSPYIRESIRLSRSKQGRQLLVESTEFMRKLVWDEDSKVSLDSGFYSGEIMKAAILTSELDEVVDHIELTLRDFSLVKYQNPRNNQGRHLLRGAIGSKASFFLLREVLRCFSRSNQWTQNLDKASNYAYVVSDPLARALECEQGDDTYRAQYINELFKRHCSIAPHEVGFDLQLRTKLGCL